MDSTLAVRLSLPVRRRIRLSGAVRACGLAVIFGMMGVINLAHGEFIMCGAYVTVTAATLGAAAAACDRVRRAGRRHGRRCCVERLVIRHLYDRPLDTIVATWGLSLIATQGTLILLGSEHAGVGDAARQLADRRLFLFDLSLRADGAARGDPGRTLSALQLDPVRRARPRHDPGSRTWPRPSASIRGSIYSLTFAHRRRARRRLTGGLYAPTMTLVPTMGATFIMEAFVTVVIGGADIFLGTAPAGVVLGFIKAAMTSWQGQLFGPDRPADRRHHRHPGAAEGHLRLHPARTDLRAAMRTMTRLSRFVSPARRSADARPRPRFWIGAAGRARARRAPIRWSPMATRSATPSISSPGSSWRSACA